MKLFDLYSKNLTEGLRDPADNPCWKGYHPVGTKKKDGRTVPNCVPNANEGVEEGSDSKSAGQAIQKLQSFAKMNPDFTLSDLERLPSHGMSIKQTLSNAMQACDMLKQQYLANKQPGNAQFIDNLKSEIKWFLTDRTQSQDPATLGELLQGTLGKVNFQQGVAEGSLEEYGDTTKGQKMLAKVHHRAADRVTSKQADKDPAYARKAQQTQDRAWDRLAVKEQGMGEGIKGEIVGGTIGGLVGHAAGFKLGTIGSTIGSAIGGSVGSAIGGRWEDNKPLKEKQQLKEFAPLLVAGARALLPLIARVGPALGRAAATAGKQGAKATVQGAGQAARAGAEIAAKNAVPIGTGVGIYSALTDLADKAAGGIGEVYQDVKDATGAIAAHVGNAIDKNTLLQLATMAVKYAIPIGIVIALLYGGKKVIDKVLAEGEKVGHMDADRFDDAVARLKKLAGAGPMKTVYDPNTRRYKNVPTAVQPKTK